MFSFFVAFLLSFIFARHLCEFFLCCTYKKKNTVDKFCPYESACSHVSLGWAPLTQEDIDRYRNNYSNEKLLDLPLKDQNIDDNKKE